MLDAGPTVTVDGEMPWDKGQSLDPAAWSEVIPGDLAAQRLQSMHYATFSRSHNATVTLPAWRTTPMPEARVDELKLPKDPAYFSDREPTQYEYIRDHLGYRLSAKSLDLAVEDGTLQVSGDIANTGFSAPVKDYPVTVSLLDEDGKVVAEDEVDADLRTWQGAPAAERATAAPAAPEYPIEASLPLASLGEGNYTVALTIGDAEAAGQSAQLANVDVTFDDGRNELATITAEAPEPSPSPSPSSLGDAEADPDGEADPERQAVAEHAPWRQLVGLGHSWPPRRQQPPVAHHLRGVLRHPPLPHRDLGKHRPPRQREVRGEQRMVFNNLTYLPMKRATWGSNPLANNVRWTAADGREWATECDTARTGRNGCRSYATASVIVRFGSTYKVETKWVFNNIVQFG